jgi:Ca2+-binding RTX toxin-like protein
VTLDNVASINGGGGVDTLTRSTTADVIRGDAGDDTINGGGGGGDDTIQFSGTGDGFDAVTGAAGSDVIAATVANTNVGLRSLATIEQITGARFANVHVLGSSAANTLNLATVTITNIVDVDGAGGNGGPAGSTLVTIGANSVTLLAIAPATVTVEDFTLAP